MLVLGYRLVYVRLLYGRCAPHRKQHIYEPVGDAFIYIYIFFLLFDNFRNFLLR